MSLNYIIKVLILYYLWIMPYGLLSQNQTNQKLDSTFMVINKLRMTQPDSALTLCNQLLEVLKVNENIESLIELHLYYFRIYNYAKKDLKPAFLHLHKARYLAQKVNSKKLPSVFQNLGRYYRNSSIQLDSALYYSLLAVNSNPPTGHEYSLSHYHSDLAALYVILNDSEKATLYIEKALDFLRKKGSRMDYGYALHNAKEIYKMKPDSAKLNLIEIEYQAFKSGKEESSEIAHQNSSYNPNGKSKKEFLTKSLHIQESNNNLVPLLANRLELANQLIKDKQFDEAIKVLNDGLIHINDSTLLFKLDFFTKLKKLYIIKNNFKEALAVSDTLANVNLHLMDEKKLEAIKEMEAKYEKIENEQRIRILEREKAISTKNFYILSLLISILAILAVAMFLLLNQKKKNYSELSSKNNIITTMLAEKDLLLKEIHHRVKNNLQVVSSLLQLQSNYIHDGAALEAIKDGKNRVSSMALIHQNLYSEDHLSSIETSTYFDRLLNQIFESYNIEENQVALLKDIDSTLLDVDTMIPLGLITNELITNALKHAFIAEKNGQIEFSLKEVNDQIIIKIKDNGVGVTLEKFNNSKSFGNKMIQAFVKKMKAKFDLLNDNGTEITLLIDKPRKLLNAI